MTYTRLPVILLCAILGACAASNIRSGDGQNETRELLTNEALRSAVIGKIITFPEGWALTGYQCYIFERGGRVLTCSGGVQKKYGELTVLDEHICAGVESSTCWQFYRDINGEYFIRHLAFTPRQLEEPVCIEEWMGRVEPCQLPASLHRPSLPK